MKNNVKELCSIYGVSGHEADVASFIMEQISPFCECSVDNLGNVIAFRKGKNSSKRNVAFFAHMDEVGFLVSNVASNGSLKLAEVGGTNANILVGQSLVVCARERLIPGVIGVEPIHLQNSDERYRPVRIEDLSLDIGCSSRQEAENLVEPGDMVCFCENFNQFGKGLIASKALDDRVGCAILIELIRTFDEFDFHAAFTTTEEIGNSGAKAAAQSLNPEIAIVIECTTAADAPPTESENKICALGQGPVISFMDKGTIYDKELVDLAFKVAKENDIKIQHKKGVYGANDSSVIRTSGVGIKTLAVSVPVRYLHSQSSVAGIDDIDQTLQLLKSLMLKICGGGV
ncbi:aminopeptidase [Clostridia bacterium]|nr:aminopeptidase [Clostridia bacterium]